MMIPSVAFSLLTQTSTPSITAKATLSGASLFKNGYAVVNRTIPITKPGVTTVVEVPRGSFGTVWFTPSEGVTLDSVVVEIETKPMSTPASSIDAVLQANLGRTVTLVLQNEKRTILTAKLISANGTVVVVDTSTIRVIQKSEVVGIEGKDLKATTSSHQPRRVMRLRTSGGTGTVTYLGMERGLSWIPAYAVNLDPDGKSLNLVAKATISNDLEAVTDLPCRLVTGFPNVPFAASLDPLFEGNYTSFGTGGMGMGGMGGGAFMNQMAAPVDGRIVGRKADVGSDAGAPSPEDGTYEGELFFYKRPGVTLNYGARGAYTLFKIDSSYETVYTWDIADSVQGLRYAPPSDAPAEVWQTLKFKNTSSMPLTTGPATTLSGGEIIGQDTLKYVSPGQEAQLRVTRALDVAAEATEEESARERGAIKRPDGTAVFDRVIAKGTLSVVNRKSKPVTMRIVKSFTGEWLSGAPEALVTTTAGGLRQVNPTGRAEWTIKLEPGESKKLTYSVSLLVSSQFNQ